MKELIDEEIIIYNQAVKDTVEKILQILHDLGGCDATDDWDKGWDKAIDTAYEEIENKYKEYLEA